MNLTQPRQICIFLGQIEKGRMTRPQAQYIGLKVEEAMTSTEIDV